MRTIATLGTSQDNKRKGVGIDERVENKAFRLPAEFIDHAIQYALIKEGADTRRSMYDGYSCHGAVSNSLSVGPHTTASVASCYVAPKPLIMYRVRLQIITQEME